MEISILEHMEKWANEMGIDDLTWHELALLKSFGSWLELQHRLGKLAQQDAQSVDNHSKDTDANKQRPA